jgi:5'-nucleotidase
MPAAEDDRLIVAISSRALFDLEESHRVYVEQGVDAYCRYQIEHENELLEPGVAFGLVRKLLALNNGVEGAGRQRVEVVLISRNSADTGLRVFNSINHYELAISRAAFSGGESPFRYVRPFNAHLFLSAAAEDVCEALDAGIAAATILPSKVGGSAAGQLRIAFDGDAVLFGDEAERIYQEQGLAAFTDSERRSAREPLPGGPFKGVLAALHRIQAGYPPDRAPIRTALFTARSAPAHERVIRTLRLWKIRIDEAVFLGGLDKGEFLKTFGADIFFDDQRGHCDSTRRHVPTGHVPHGVTNRAAG